MRPKESTPNAHLKKLATRMEHGRWLNEGQHRSATGILEKPVSDRGTLEDLSQSRPSRSTSDRKLLILNGEMSEWLKEHAWKTNPATLTE